MNEGIALRRGEGRLVFNATLERLTAGATAVDGADRALRVSDWLPQRGATLAGMPGVLLNRAGDFDLQGREAWLFISIKNRRFTKSYIAWFVRFCEEHGLEGHVSPVDNPYLFNRMAELGLDDLDDLPSAEAAKIGQLSSETARKAQKAINGHLSKRVDIVSWGDIETETPRVLLDEMRAAFDARTPVRDALHRHISSVKPVACERSFERYAEFFLREVPVLLHAYYRCGGTLDVYPGSQPDFFWEIETGRYARELPKLTALTKSGRSMLYMETHDQADGAK